MALKRETLVKTDQHKKPEVILVGDTKDISQILHNFYSLVHQQETKNRMISNRADFIKKSIENQNTLHIKVRTIGYLTNTPEQDIWVLVDTVNKELLEVSGHIDNEQIDNEYDLHPGDRVQFKIENSIQVMLTTE